MRKKTLDAMLLYTMEMISPLKQKSSKDGLNKDCLMWKTTAKALFKLN